VRAQPSFKGTASARMAVAFAIVSFVVFWLGLALFVIGIGAD
jgi:hypothetical protein